MLHIRRHPEFSPELTATLTQGIAMLFEQGHTLSSGSSQVVKQCTINGKDLIIKRYNATGPFAALRLILGVSRADNAFRSATYLQKHRLNVPNHLLVIKQTGIFKSQSYLVMDKAPGIPLFDFIQANSTLSLDPEAIDNVAKLIITMHWLGVAHGDLHTRNFIIANDHSVTLIDLDGTKFSKMRREKDIDRFTQAVETGARYSNELLESLENASHQVPNRS